MKKLLVLPGDGIGPEICEAVLPVFKQLALPIELTVGEIGQVCWHQAGNTVPEKTWQQIAQSDAVLLGTLTSPGKQQAEATLPTELQGQGIKYVSPLTQLQQRLDLFANVRPAQHWVGKHRPFRCCVIYGNTEGRYAGRGQRDLPEVMQGILQRPGLACHGVEEGSLNIRHGLARLFQYAFEHANAQGYSRVTFADKPNALHKDELLAADIFYSIAAHHPTIRADIQYVNDLTLSLVRKPEEFGVIVTDNMFGDLLSDLVAGMMGGLGVAPSINVSQKICCFAPAHGEALEMVGKDRANPTAMFLSVALALRHLGFASQASSLEQAVRSVMMKERHVTYDLGGQAGTRSMAQAILDEVAHPQPSRQASILCIGDELLRGQNSNTNAQEFAQRLSQAQYGVSLQMVCGDQPSSICHALETCLGHADLIIVSGGLGPTSDDVTREAIASTAGVQLQLDEPSWIAIQARLQGFGLEVAPSNRRQAFFPQGARIVPNKNGTAPGFTMTIDGRTLHVLPGPPKECLPMLETLLAQEEKETPTPSQEIYHLRLLGVIESDIAQIVDAQLTEIREHAEVSYLCHYPYMNIRVAIAARKQKELAEKMTELEILFKDNLVSKEERTALEQLETYLTQYPLMIEDTLTQGVFAARIASQFKAKCLAPSVPTLPITVKASTADSLGPPFHGSTLFQCSIELGTEHHDYAMRTPKRGPEIVDSACEFIAWSILRSCQQLEVRGLK